MNQAFVPVAFQRESCLIFLGHMETRTLRCAVICNIWVEGCVHVCMQTKWWNGTFTQELDEGYAVSSSRGSVSAHMPPCPSPAEGEWVKKEGTKFSSLPHNPRERQDLDITANWQRALRSRLDLPLPLKFIFQPLCFGKFHQVLDRAVIREAGYDCSCTKGPLFEEWDDALSNSC